MVMILKLLPRLFIACVLVASAALCQQSTAVPQESKTAPQGKEKEPSGFRFTFDNVAGALGILFGLITLIAYLDQKRSARQQADVMAYVKRNMTKEVTEETIAALSTQLKLMQKQTKEELPKLARIAVLNEQADRIKTAM